MQPEEVVDKSLRALGKAQVLCIPGFRRQLMVKLACVLPRPIYYKVMKAISEKVRKRWDEIEKA